VIGTIHFTEALKRSVSGKVTNRMDRFDYDGIRRFKLCLFKTEECTGHELNEVNGEKVWGGIPTDKHGNGARSYKIIVVDTKCS